MTYYHVTAKRNLKKILKDGLVPKVGARSKKLRETPGVYFFTDLVEARDGVSNWLGDEFSDRTTLVCLKITPPKHIEFTLDPEICGHAISSERVPPEWISVESLNF